MAKQDVTVELFYSSQWNDHTSDALVRDGIDITRGRSNEQQQPAPGRCKLTFSGWRFNPHNPSSNLNGLIGRNTPLRVYLGTPHVGESNFDVVDTTSHVAPSVDSPTDGGLLLCAWAAPESGETYTVPGSMTEVSTFGDSRSTMKSAREAISSVGATGTRTATFGTSEDYVAASVLLHGTNLAVEEAEVDSVDQILAVDSDTQAGWWAVVFSYWAWDGDADIPDFPVTDEGGWLLLGDTGTIFVDDAHAENIRMKAWAKRWATAGGRDIHIAGPVDSLSCLYVVSGVGEWDVRFSGEVASWSPRQSLGGDNAAPDRWVEVVAADPTRRLGQGADPLKDALTRFMTVGAGASNLAGYWPLDGRVQGRQQSGVVGGPMRIVSEIPNDANIVYGTAELAPWLGTGSTFEGATNVLLGASAHARVDISGSDRLVFDHVFRLPSAALDEDSGHRVWLQGIPREDGDGFGVAIDSINDSGTAEDPNWQFEFRIGVHVDLPPVTILFDDTDLPQLADGRPHHLRVDLSLNTGTGEITYAVYFDGSEILSGSTSTSFDELWVDLVRTSTYTLTPGSVIVGRIGVWSGTPPDLDDAVAAAFGHQGEHAGRRIERLCAEQDVPFAGAGDLDDTLPCGPQHPDGFLAILREAAAVDLGDLTGGRASRAVAYRTGRSRYNQGAALALDYDSAQVAPPLDPVVDDQQTRNDVTAKRRNGGEQRAVDETGPLGVDGIGRYDTDVTVNTLSDGHDLQAQAGWRLHLGTVEGTRFPKVTVDLDATPTLAGAAGGVDAGNLLTLANLPAELTPDLARLLALGYTETIGSHRRRVTYNCTPEEPYHIADPTGEVNNRVGFSALWRRDGAISSGGTAITLRNEEGPDVTHESDFDIVIGGERMTVTAIGSWGGTYPNRFAVFTVTRSVNGVVKSHPDDSQVRLFTRAYIGL